MNCSDICLWVFIPDWPFESVQAWNLAKIKLLTFWDDIGYLNSTVTELLCEMDCEYMGFVGFSIHNDWVFVIDVVIDKFISRGIADMGVVDPLRSQVVLTYYFGWELFLEKDLGDGVVFFFLILFPVGLLKHLLFFHFLCFRLRIFGLNIESQYSITGS